ncbi:phage holin [Halalkalibacterium halodurans]|uniref:phage holin n=1 Tax=Halalkalibacterium halodurans TaxID=86665 RepID=UPI002E1C8BB7|nr:phage holin [Halalkalibacterium halodurans]MED4083861.1 phage holin [Halalkalibacterium halodurans]MED4105498.1 phage holin [Halalkalibacterium halodurans]MED4109296.1 phage holin [Halalkalibacterium halodurans]MED4149690.1 phage holin [Halalkalibacterium halodurans]
MDKGTVVRTVALAIAWINMVLVKYDMQPIPVVDEESIATGLAFFMSVWAWFKNNYITARGKEQKEVLQEVGLIKEDK